MKNLIEVGVEERKEWKRDGQKSSAGQERQRLGPMAKERDGKKTVFNNQGRAVQQQFSNHHLSLKSTRESERKALLACMSSSCQNNHSLAQMVQ